MPLFEEDPVHLSKSRLKSDLVAHNVALPPAKSRKEVYVELHLKHIDQKHAADFSSDEEEQVHDVEDKDEDPEETEIPDPSGLTDDELKAALLAHGVKVGPIVASTRALYEKKLRTLLQSNGHDHLNGTEKAELYSDSEEEEENGEEEEKECDYEEGKDETTEQSEQAPQESSQVKTYFHQGHFVYPQCFLPSPRLHARPSGNKEPAPKRNSGNALKSSERGQSHRSQIPAGISKASSVDQLSGLGSGVTSGLQSVKTSGCSSFPFQAFSITEMVEQMESRASFSSCPDTERALNGSNVHDHWSRSSRQPQGPAKDVFKDMFPDTPATPTGIYASRRRPIKGAAGRPIQYAYPDTPASPTTLQRRELERRLVPIQIQIAVFLAVACLLFLIYVFAEDDSLSSVVALLESLTQESDSEDGLLLQAESQEIPPLSGQE
ncbi:LEM domain-containing protein 1 isoform X3 [Cheilinus undulatus]|uniref:LEM domain-containing protein 1 isoform X3 n=1 Tax=Cheilinus undulatus TaxID=241271 RepID=UPI001BD38144|nr:LEM domain-containing protein 1 isoform X3 [Cheilinus undulatus]